MKINRALISVSNKTGIVDFAKGLRKHGVTIISTEGEQGVLANLKRKAIQADDMFNSLVANMNRAMHIHRGTKYPEKERVPTWL